MFANDDFGTFWVFIEFAALALSVGIFIAKQSGLAKRILLEISELKLDIEKLEPIIKNHNDELKNRTDTIKDKVSEILTRIEYINGRKS